jgi:hypothetical protein
MDSAKFLADKDDVRQYLTTPMIIDGYEVCTNGRVMIFTPVHGKENRTNGALESTISAIRRVRDEVDAATEWREPPAVTYPDKVPCDTCGGVGKATKMRCPDCDGEGVHYFFEGRHEYECECQECDGNGDLVTGDQEDGDACKDCNGDGMVFDLNHPLHFFDMWINPYYYPLIDSEPGLLLCPKPEASQLYFRAGEQFGAVMGMREPKIVLAKEAA